MGFTEEWGERTGYDGTDIRGERVGCGTSCLFLILLCRVMFVGI